MTTFILNQQTANLPVQDLLSQLANGSVEVLDAEGKPIAYLLTPDVREELIYAEAELVLNKDPDKIKQALQRRGGITTEELLKRANEAAEKSLLS